MKKIRVTEPLQRFNKFDGIPPAVLASAAKRGTELHAAFAAYAKGLMPPPFPDDQVGFFDSFRRWFDEYVERVHFVEQEMVCDKLGLIGHSDIGCQLVDGRDMVVDYKNAAVASKTWPLQISAYFYLANKTRPENYDGAMTLQPRKDGKPAKAIVCENIERSFGLYRCALTLHRHFGG